MSATAGLAHVRCGTSIGAAHPVPISADVPVFPSNANIRWPNAINNSGSSSPSKSIEIGADTAISSLSVPPPRCKVRDHSLNGGSIVMSWQPVTPALSVNSMGYQVTQQTLSVIPFPVVSTDSGSASA